MVEQDLKSVAFPNLDERYMAALEKCTLTKRRKVRDSEKLLEVGQHDFNFYIVISGQVEIIEDPDDASRIVTNLKRGQFTGEVAQLTGGPSIVSAVARSECDVFEVTPAALREILIEHPDLGDIILQAFIARREILTKSGKFVGLRVIGSRFSHDTFRLRDFLAKNRVSFTWLDLETNAEVTRLLKLFGVKPEETPVVVLGHKLLLRNPSNRELAESIGIRRPVEQTVYDLAIVGAGPAGLAAAVYGASEGLNTLVLERAGPGGQAGRSMRIENYLGFPTGITGGDLTDRAVLQANKFGAHLSVPSAAMGLTFEDTYSVLRLDDNQTVVAKCLLIASGADYRKLDMAACERYEGCGVYYAATPNEATLCQGADVVVVGGGNSAGQAAVFLASQARQVYLVIRGDNLHKDMSSYLARRIEGTPNIEVLLNTQVVDMKGGGFLTEVELLSTRTGERRKINTPALFSFIGAVPRTEWLPSQIERDQVGFVKTGADLAQSTQWTLRRQPFLLESSRPGVFAAGDVRYGSVKRVASAVGEGAMAVRFVHEYMKEM